MVARLHHEAIASGAPVRWLVFTHGILGSGGNWRTIARTIVQRRPEWGVHLVDLRQHGRSEPGEPPHTIAACAADLRALIDNLHTASGGAARPTSLGPVAALAGHSFGGKVALATRALHPPGLLQTWTIDAAPGPRVAENDTAYALLAFADRAPHTWARREDFVAALVAEGHPASLAHWFAMNLASADGGYRVHVDTAAIRALLADYAAVDLWPSVLDRAGGAVELVQASRSTTYSDADRTHALAAHVRMSIVDGGHWLNVDNPGALVDLFAERLP